MAGVTAVFKALSNPNRRKVYQIICRTSSRNSKGITIEQICKQAVLKTSGGKYLTPQPIENRLKLNPCILSAVVIGDGRKFPSVLIVPAPGTAREAVQAAVDDVNKDLAKYEQLKKFVLVEKDFTIEGGELTPTMKVRRRVVAEKYRDLIESMYAD